ncbi:hypothetical protein PJN21_25165, partial [Mycobacterium kansasii]
MASRLEPQNGSLRTGGSIAAGEAGLTGGADAASWAARTADTTGPTCTAARARAANARRGAVQRGATAAAPAADPAGASGAS